MTIFEKGQSTGSKKNGLLHRDSKKQRNHEMPHQACKQIGNWFHIPKDKTL